MEQHPQSESITQNIKMSGRTKAALWCLIAPTALWVIVFFLFALINWGLASLGLGADSYNSDSLFRETPIIVSLLNIILFLTGVVAFITWLPGIIVGIILLATKKSTPPSI